MKFFIVDKVIRLAGRRLDGKKTYAGAAGKILAGLASLCTGVVGLLAHAFPDQGLPRMDLETAWTTAAAGLYAISSGIEGIGLGHKAEKIKRDLAGQKNIDS